MWYSCLVIINLKSFWDYVLTTLLLSRKFGRLGLFCQYTGSQVNQRKRHLLVQATVTELDPAWGWRTTSLSPRIGSTCVFSRFLLSHLIFSPGIEQTSHDFSWLMSFNVVGRISETSHVRFAVSHSWEALRCILLGPNNNFYVVS